MSNFYDICSEGNYDEALKAITKDDWNQGLGVACKEGNMKTVKYLIKKGASDWNWGLRFACYGGHMKIVKLMIKKGANDFISGLNDACNKSYIKIAKLMLEKYAHNCKIYINSEQIYGLLYINTNIKTLNKHIDYKKILNKHIDYKKILKDIKKSQNMILQYNY